MTSLALAVACSLAIAMIFKYAAHRGFDRIALLTANYVAAFVLSVLVLDVSGFDPDAALSIMGLVTGALFIAGFFMQALATEVAGMSLATAVMRISVVIPFLASWMIWRETPTPFQFAGLAVAGCAFFLISRRPAEPMEEIKTSARRHAATLTLLFIVGGVIDTLMKAFDEEFAAQHSSAVFMTMVFGVAALIGLLIVVSRRRRPSGAVVGWGVLLGAANFGSVEFILRAIRELSGPFVFPANNILVVIGSALLGVVLWKERLSWMNWAGLALAAVALLLLNL